MHKDGLTREEFASIMSLEDEKAEGSEATQSVIPPEESEIAAYDFFQQRMFVSDALRTLEEIHSRFIANFRIWISGHLRSMFEMKMAAVEQKTFSEFRDRLPDPTYVNIFGLRPLEGNAVLHIDLGLAFIFVDKLLGGLGEPLTDSNLRALSPVEMRIMASVISHIYESLKEVWQPIYPLVPVALSDEAHPQFVEIGVMPEDTVVHISFDVSYGQYQAQMDLCIPYVVLQPIRNQLVGRRIQVEGTSRTSIQQHLMKVRVPVRAILAEHTRTLRELLELNENDVIPFNKEITKHAVVVVGKTPRFLATPGIGSGRRMAVKLVSEIKDEEEKESAESSSAAEPGETTERIENG